MRFRPIFVALGTGLAACACCAACSPGKADHDASAGSQPEAAEPLQEVALIDPSQFLGADLKHDPLADHQPSAVHCGLAGFYLERGELELDTGACNYLYIEAPALHDVALGSELRLSLRHFDLTAPEPASTHVALLFGDRVQWELTVAVPGPADSYELSFQSSAALALGDPIRLHLHNHGQNTWTLSSLRALVPED